MYKRQVEIKLAAAIKRGLYVYKNTGSPSNTGDDTTSGRRDSTEGNTPVGIPTAASAASMQQTTYCSANSVGTPSFQAQEAEADPSRQEGTGHDPPDQRTGIRRKEMLDLRDIGLMVSRRLKQLMVSRRLTHLFQVFIQKGVK